MDNFENDSLSHDDDDDWPIGVSEGGQALSEGEMREKVKNTAKKYLKKIKILQQNKRQQDTKIERLSRDNRSLREKIGVQAAYVDVLCGFLGEDGKEKFKARQGLGILGGDACPGDLVDVVKEQMSFTGGTMDVKTGEDIDSESTSPASLHLDPLSHHQPSFSTELLLDHDHHDSFVTDLGDDGHMSHNHLYCIEEISQQDSTSLFIC